MTYIFFIIIASSIACFNFNLIDLNKYKYESFIANLLDIIILSLLLNIIIELIDLNLENTLIFLFLIIISILTLGLYFMIFRKLMYKFILQSKTKKINIDNTNYTIIIGDFSENFEHIPFYNNFLISESIYLELNEEDLKNLILIYFKDSINIIYTLLNYLIPTIIFYIAYVLVESTIKTPLIIIAGLSFVFLKKFFRKFLNFQKIKNKSESKKALIKYFEILKRNRNKFKKIELDFLLKNKIRLIDNAS